MSCAAPGLSEQCHCIIPALCCAAMGAGRLMDAMLARLQRKLASFLATTSEKLVGAMYCLSLVRPSVRRTLLSQ